MKSRREITNGKKIKPPMSEGEYTRLYQLDKNGKKRGVIFQLNMRTRSRKGGTS